MSIEDKIRKFIREELSFSGDQPLGDNDSFLAEGIIDSMGAFELVAFVEAAFGIKVQIAEVVVKNFNSIGQLAAFVRQKLAAAGQSMPVETVVSQLPPEPAAPDVSIAVSPSAPNSTNSP